MSVEFNREKEGVRESRREEMNDNTELRDVSVRDTRDEEISYSGEKERTDQSLIDKGSVFVNSLF